MVVRQGFGSTFDRLPQIEAMVRWLPGYNADPSHVRKVNIYGLDAPGSVGNSRSTRSVVTALVEALAYLSRVDARCAAALHARLDPLMQDVHVDQCKPMAELPRMSTRDKDALTSASRATRRSYPGCSERGSRACETSDSRTRRQGVCDIRPPARHDVPLPPKRP